MIELVAVFIGLVFVVIGSWLALRNRFCPTCGELLERRFFHDQKSLNDGVGGWSRNGEPLFYRCVRCDKSYSAWKTYSNDFNKK